jgi:formate dehydrogenase subunit delta
MNGGLPVEHVPMSPEKTIRMANQIATFFESQGEDEALRGFADHINSFWEPRMRSQLLDMLDQGAPGFHPLVVGSLKALRRPKSTAA